MFAVVVLEFNASTFFGNGLDTVRLDTVGLDTVRICACCQDRITGSEHATARADMPGASLDDGRTL